MSCAQRGSEEGRMMSVLDSINGQPKIDDADATLVSELAAPIPPSWPLLAEQPRLDASASGLISAEQAVRLRSVPFQIEHGRLGVVMADPNDFAAADELSVLTGMPIERFGAAPGLFEGLLRTAFGATAAQMAARLSGGGGPEDDLTNNLQAVEADDVQRMAEQPTLINLVNLIILEAVRSRAS